MKRNLVRFDWAIKRLLRNKANFVILEGFLTELLKFDVKIIKILESEGNQNLNDDKYNRVDILAETDTKEVIIVEIQNRDEYDYFQRMLYGTSKVVTEYISKGDPYKKVKKIYSINIVYFNLGEGKDYVYHGTTDFFGIHHNDKLMLTERQKESHNISTPADIFPEYYIINVSKFDDKAKNRLDEWIYFLKNDKIEENFTAKGLDEAKELLDVMKLTDDELSTYNRYLNNLHYAASMNYTLKKEAEIKVRKQGEINGRNNEKINTVINSHKIGIDVETIAKITNLTIKEVKAIIEKR